MSSSGSTEPAGPSEAEAPGDGTRPSAGGGSDARLAPRRRPRPVFLLVGVAAAALLSAVLVVVGANRSSAGHPEAGSAVPTFTLPRLGGGTVNVPGTGGGRGRPAVLLFFASWCTPCQHEIPALAAAYRHQQSSGNRLAKVALIGVDGNDPTRAALAFVHRSGVTFPVGVDRSYAVTSGEFDFSGLPESVMVSGNGTIEAIHYGALSSADLVRWERRLLAVPG